MRVKVEREDLPSANSLPKTVAVARAGPGHGQELHPGLAGGRGPHTRVTCCCFPRHTGRKLDQHSYRKSVSQTVSQPAVPEASP